MRAPKELHETWCLAIKQGHATPRPETLMQRRKRGVVCGAIRDKYKCLRNRRATVTPRLKEDRVSLIGCGPLHHGNFFGRTPVALVSFYRYESINGQSLCGCVEIDKPFCSISHAYSISVDCPRAHGAGWRTTNWTSPAF